LSGAGAGGMADQGAEERLDDLGWLERLSAGCIFERVQEIEAFLVQRCQPALEDGMHEPVFGAEVIIDRRQVDTRGGSDLPHGCVVMSLMCEQLFGSIEDDVTSGVDARES